MGKARDTQKEVKKKSEKTLKEKRKEKKAKKAQRNWEIPCKIRNSGI